MRIRPAADDALERVALAMNLVPLPAAYVMYGMTSGRVVGTAQRLGIFAQLLKGPATAGRLAEELSLQVAGTRLLCESLAGLEILEQDGHTFSMSKSARKWLDPASDTYIGTWIEHTVTYWEWYGDLERIVREGGSFEIHREPAEDEEYWRVYITGQYELARLSAEEVAKAISLGPKPTSLLDVAGAHGWFSATLCGRHDTLRATVVDLPGSARVGREIIAAAGMSERVEHRDGDMFTTDLGGPYDGALVFDIIHHLSGEQTVALLRRVRESMRPGGTLAVLDMFRADAGAKRQRGSAAVSGLLFHLTSGADLQSPGELGDHMREAGFSKPKRTKIRRIPDQDLYQAQAV
jgi:O-methyltransferase domain/Dimerisation domain